MTRHRAARRRYGLIVGIEFGVAGLGAAVLAITRAEAYIPAFVCAVAILALVLRLTGGVAPGTVTGIGAGGLLASYALVSLIAALAWPAPP